MCKLLMSINPEHVENILSGEKRYEFFDKYYAGRSFAVAYVLGKVHRFKTPQTLEYYGIKSAPQSYVYIRN